MPLIMNPKGRIVAVDEDRKEFLLNPNPTHIDPVTGKRSSLTKQEHERGYREPTAAEVAEYEAELSGATKKPAKPSVKTKKKEEKTNPSAETEAKVRDAEGDKTKYDALTNEEKQLYMELFGDEPSA